MKKESYLVFHFMSWDNEDSDGSSIRAIALCDDDGYFDEAINCVMDGDMGRKDEKGVYDRHWYGDYICNCCNKKNIRCATHEEVCMYKEYVDIEKSIPVMYGIDDCYDMEIVEENYTHLLDENIPQYIVCKVKKISWWKRIKKALSIKHKLAWKL